MQGLTCWVQAKPPPRDTAGDAWLWKYTQKEKVGVIGLKMHQQHH